MNDLQALGFGPDFDLALDNDPPPADWFPARVSAQYRGSLRALCAAGELSVTPSGRLAHAAAGPEDLPAVGDWVLCALRPEGGSAIVQRVLPRRTALVRKAAGRAMGAQVLAANMDEVWLVASANKNFNLRRLERALALVVESGTVPVVIVSKCDLAEDPDSYLERARGLAPDLAVHAVSSLSGHGLGEIGVRLAPGRTAVLLGSSGVGKSTLLNRLVGHDLQHTIEIREEDDRGRHATTHRQLVRLPSGGLLVDTPGLREIGLFEDTADLGDVFAEIEALAGDCRFRDCRHEREPGCAVRAAIASGELDPARIESRERLERERARAREKRDAAARHEHRERMKKFSKQVKGAMDRKRRGR